MISEFRSVWHGCRVGCDSRDAEGFGPRGAGKVARWALERAAAILEVSGRTRLRIAEDENADLTPHERSLDLIARSLAEGDVETARAHAQWLVKPNAIHPFLRALEPVTTGPARLVRAA